GPEPDPADVDLRPSAWRVHLVVVGVLIALFAAFAAVAWPRGGGHDLHSNLQGAVVILYGIGLAWLILIASVTLAILGGRRLGVAYGVSLALAALLIVAQLGRC
ncbi:MAG: hypothetical protein KC464_04200, partial [Myxococcales bacterium]|nr:hypothetical protein [Myxococcales bacterium]